MDRRRQDIAEKRAKLAELRKAREERRSRLDDERGSAGSAPSQRPTRSEIDSLVSDLLTPSGPPSTSSGLLSPAHNLPQPPVTSLSGTKAHSPGGRPSLAKRSSHESFSAGQQTASDPDQRDAQNLAPLHPTQNASVSGTSPLSALPTLTDSFRDLYEFAPKPRLFYNKSVQTQPVPVSPAPPVSAGSNPLGSTSTHTTNEEELKIRLIKEIEADRLQLEMEIKEEKRRLEKEMEEDRLRGLEPSALASIYSDLEFNEFLESSSKIIQRALSDGYDYLKDYSAHLGDEDGMDEREGKRVKRSCEFYNEKLLKHRSVTGLDWSSKNPELSLASYNKNPHAVNEPDGMVCVWNLHLLDRPEYVFHSQADVLSATFSPFHPNLVIGGTYSGQILIWDIRHRKQLPVLKTPLSSSGHTHPIYSISIVGTQNSHNLLSVSTDGTICSWVMDMLAQPQDWIEVTNLNHQRTEEMSPTCFGLPTNEVNTIWFGTEEGCVYEANRFNRAGLKSGLIPSLVYKGHSGPVLGIDFHPMSGPVDLSDLFLTCGVDWTVKLWRPRETNHKNESGQQGDPTSSRPRIIPAPGNSKPGSVLGNPINVVAPMYSFEEADDYIFDVKWHPIHPAMFGTVDGSGKLNLWNLNSDTEVPTVSTTINSVQPRGLNKLSWDKREGKKLAAGSIDGKVYIYDIGDMALPKENEWDQMRKTISNMLGANSGMSALDVR